MRPDSDLLAIVAAILISGTTHTPEEGVSKAKALLAVAATEAKKQEAE